MAEFKEKGNEYFKKGEYDEALKLYSQAIDSEPSNHIFYSNRSACYFKLGKYQESLNDAKKCVEINHSWAKGYQRKGLAENKLNLLWQGFVSYSIGSLYDTKNDSIQNELKDIFKSVTTKFSQKFLTMAGDENVKNLMKDPNNLKDLMNPSADKIFEKSRDSEDFVSVVSKILEVDKQLVKKDVDEYFKIKISLHTGFESESFKYEKGDKPQTGGNREQALKVASEDFHKANDLFVNEEYEKALEMYDDAIQHDHSNMSYVINRAACYLKLNDDVLALEDCNLALKNGIKSARVYYLKAQAYKLIGKDDLVKQTIEEGLKLWANDEKLLSLK